MSTLFFDLEYDELENDEPDNENPPVEDAEGVYCQECGTLIENGFQCPECGLINDYYDDLLTDDFEAEI